ncbi:MAG: hypothetical protein DMG05_06685 [Acidobacteria bacterium]|nr:MAG: hypothetical protein DMG05_06685 [Acidobacteriota bacterium]
MAVKAKTLGFETHEGIISGYPLFQVHEINPLQRDRIVWKSPQRILLPSVILGVFSVRLGFYLVPKSPGGC